MTQPPCTASITNEHSRGTHHCVLEAGHQDPEWGGDHASAEDEDGLTFRWRDTAIGAVPHQTASQPESDAPPLRDRYAAAIASYDHAVGQAADPAPGDHHHGQADAVMAVRDQELEQLRAQVSETQIALAMQKGISADLRVESRARGEKLEQLRAQVERVRALHQPIECAEFTCDCHACCAVCRWTQSQESGRQPQWGSPDPHVYPCPTIRALDPQEQS